MHVADALGPHFNPSKLKQMQVEMTSSTTQHNNGKKGMQDT